MMLEQLKQDAHGAATLFNWLGEGMSPADEFAARHRASICLTCPKNKPGNWWERMKDKVANAIRRQMEIKHKLDLAVPNEDRLGTCTVCGCCIPLMVWCPEETLRSHAMETASHYPNHCWKKRILNEPEP